MNQTETSQNKIKELGLPPFQPLSFIQSGMAQTIASGLWPFLPEKKPKRVHKVALEDKDTLIVVEDRPSSWRLGNRIVVLVHGLGGNHQANYMVRITRKLVQSGFLVLRVNLRGCGIGRGWAKNPYHSGRSDDLRTVLHWAAQKFPGSPVTQVGYSLGANITLKLAGEDGSSPSGNLDSLIAISPPVDLSATAQHIRKSKHRLFDQVFVWKLKYDIWRQERHFPDLPRVKFPLKMNLTQLDNDYTAPRSGFKDAQDYYAKSSCGPFVSSVRVPGLILCASDDPIVHAGSYDSLVLPENLDLHMLSTGGHVGFIGETGNPTDFQWMDCLIHRWILQFQERS